MRSNPSCDRYFQQVVDDDTRLDALRHMVRAWLQMTAKEGIETWIAHGTLLGWWWNAQVRHRAILAHARRKELTRTAVTAMGLGSGRADACQHAG